MEPAFAVFDKDGSGVLNAAEFKLALPLMGEDVPPEEIEAMFEEVDADGSGKIEFVEFQALIKKMNPKEKSSESSLFGNLPDMPNVSMPDLSNPLKKEEENKGEDPNATATERIESADGN